MSNQRDNAPIVHFTKNETGFDAEVGLTDYSKLREGYKHVYKMFFFTLHDASIQELVETLDGIWPKWWDGDQWTDRSNAA